MKIFQFVGTFSVDVDVLARKSESIQNNLSILRVNKLEIEYKTEIHNLSLNVLLFIHTFQEIMSVYFRLVLSSILYQTLQNNIVCYLSIKSRIYIMTIILMQMTQHLDILFFAMNYWNNLFLGQLTTCHKNNSKQDP